MRAKPKLTEQKSIPSKPSQPILDATRARQFLARVLERRRQDRHTRAMEQLSTAMLEAARSRTLAPLNPPNGDDQNKLLTLKEAGAALNKSTKTLVRMIHKKELLATKVGGTWRINAKELHRFISH